MQTLPPISREAKEVLRHIIAFGYKPTIIVKQLKKNRSTIYKHIKKLKQLKYLDEFGLPTGGAYTFLHYSQMLHKKDYRINGLRIFYELPIWVDKHKWKANRGKLLALKKISHSSHILQNKAGLTDNYQNFYLHDKYQCRVHANGIMVYFPDIIAESGEQAEKLMLDMVEQIGVDLGNIFKIDFFKENRLNIRISNYELAHMGDKLAQEMRSEGEKVFIYIEGERRFQIDYSKGIDEAEALTVHYGLQDQNAIQAYMKDILKQEGNAILPSQIKELIINQTELIKQQQEILRLNNERITELEYNPTTQKKVKLN